MSLYDSYNGLVGFFADAKKIFVKSGGTLDIEAGGILAIGGTNIDATAAEINLNCDLSANTETIAKTTAVSVTKTYTKVDSTTGTGAITLAAPGAAMLGQKKVIEMVTDNGDITLALTNVTGGSAATTATFSAINQALILVAGTNKWHVIAESGVVLT